MNPADIRSGDGRPPPTPILSLPPSYDRPGFAEWRSRISYVIRRDPVEEAKDKVLSNLRIYPGGGTPQVEDGLFSEHTWLVGKARDQEVDRSIPIDLWANHLAPATIAAEQRIGQPIHKGAPLYNAGLCHFLNGNLQQAYIYFSQGAEEERRTRGLQPRSLLGGQHLVSRKILIAPLVAEFLPQWAAEYHAVTGRTLDETEFLALIDWLFGREADGIQFIIALHQLRTLAQAVENDATRLARLESIRSLHVAIESALRFHSVGAKEFMERMQSAMATHADATTAFTGLHSWFTGGNPPNVSVADRKTHVGLNLVIAEGLTRYAAAPTRQHRAGIIAYLAVKARNTSAHGNDHLSNLYTDRVLAHRVAGWALASCRSVRHSVEGTL